MNFTVFIAIVGVLVCLILFWPKKKEKPQDLGEDGEFTNKSTDKASNKLIKKKQADKSAAKTEGKQKPIRKKPANEMKPLMKKAPLKKGDSEKASQKIHVADLTDEELLASSINNENAVGAQAAEMNAGEQIEPSSYNAPAAETSTEKSENQPKKASRGLKRKKPSEPSLVNEPAEIVMDTEPVVHSNRNRVRKKLNSETEQVKKKEKEAIQGVAFVGTDVQGFETPNVDDLFADPLEKEQNYQDMLVKATNDASELPDDAPMIIGAPVEEEASPVVVIDDVPQVSMNLEPIDAVQQSPDSEVADKPVDEPTVSSELEDVKVVDHANAEEAQIPDNLAEEVENTESEIENGEPEIENGESETEQEIHSSSADDFEPGSVKFDNSGLKFAERPHTKKATELLPAEVPVASPENDVVLTVDSPAVKSPVKKNGMIEVYNSHLYKDNEFCPWDIRYERQLKEDEEIIVDTGIGIKIPDGYGIRLVPVENLEEKFSLAIVSPLDVSRLEAQYSLKFTVKAVGLSAYIAKNQALVRVEIFKI